ncbi:MAG: transketolase [archaeon]
MLIPTTWDSYESWCELDKLAEKARQLRKDSLDLACKNNDGHIAPAFSTVEILVALYEQKRDDDRIILSKGHGCLSLYCILRHKGHNPRYSGHPDIDPENGLACTTGSLGHGLPIGVGMAFAKKCKNEPGQVFVVMGDGECQEGSIWESANLARKYRLGNLTVIVDNNNLQALSTITEIMDESNLKGKFKAFGCRTHEIDGHDFRQILRAIEASRRNQKATDVIIARTVKGKGLSFMENDPVWHSRLPEGETLKQAYRELE